MFIPYRKKDTLYGYFQVYPPGFYLSRPSLHVAHLNTRAYGANLIVNCLKVIVLHSNLVYTALFLAGYYRMFDTHQVVTVYQSRSQF